MAKTTTATTPPITAWSTVLGAPSPARESEGQKRGTDLPKQEVNGLCFHRVDGADKLVLLLELSPWQRATWPVDIRDRIDVFWDIFFMDETEV